MTLEELKIVHETGGEVAVRLCVDTVECNFVSFVEVFPNLITVWGPTIHEWVDLLLEYPHYDKQLDFASLDGEAWAFLLRWIPRFADNCVWELLDHKDWQALGFYREPRYKEKYLECQEKNAELKFAARFDHQTSEY